MVRPEKYGFGYRNKGRFSKHKEGTTELPGRKSIAGAIAAALAASPGLVFADNLDNHIVLDSRTASTLTTPSSTLTQITTETISGGVAFNSFSDFDLDAANTLNLVLPEGVDNLVNLVTDTRAVIDGTVNSIQGDKIGGHVVFADPLGIVVGASGVLNVGSLMLTAPTQAFMTSILTMVPVSVEDPDTHVITTTEVASIDDDVASILLSGNAPLDTDPAHSINMQGTINAFGAVALEGQVVLLGGNVFSGTDAAHAALFDAAVNSAGLTAGTEATVVDGRVTIRAAGDATVSGVADASSAETGHSAGWVDISAGGDVDISGSLLAVGAIDGGNGGRIAINTSGNLNLTDTSVLNVSGTADNSMSGTGDGGTIELSAGQDLTLAAGSRLAAAGAVSGGDGGRIGLNADGTTSLTAGASLDASAGADAAGDGGEIELSGSSAALSGLNVNLAAGTSGTDGQLLIRTASVSASSSAYYTNGGDVLINAGDSLTIEAGATINTRRIDGSKSAVTITPASSLADNPAGLDEVTDADLYTTASVGNSGSVVLQAPKITVKDGARIYTFATDGYDAGSIDLVSGDNFTCNICTERDPGDYFSSVDNISNTVRVASTDDVSITIENGATLDASYVDRSGYSGAAGTGGDVTISAAASDKQVAGWSNADASLTINGAVKGANITISSAAEASVNFSWLAGLDPTDPTTAIGALSEISSTELSEIGNNSIENIDDWGDLTNLAAVGLPVTAGLAMANSKLEVGSGAVIVSDGDLIISSTANRSVDGASGGLLTSALPDLGIGAIYGQVSGTTSAKVSGTASLTAGTLDVTATSNNAMEIGAEAEVTATKDPEKGNSSAAFALAIGYANVTTEAIVGDGVSINKAAGSDLGITVHASNLDSFTTEASSTAVVESGTSSAPSQGAMTVAFSLWNTHSNAEFDASPLVAIDSLDVIAENMSIARVTKATVKNGSNLFDHLLGSKKDRKSGLDALITGAYTRSGNSASFDLAAAAAITLSTQTAHAKIGDGVEVDAAQDVTVRSRVVDQGIRSIADSRVNSSAGSGATKKSGSVAVTVGIYNHSSTAEVGDGADITAEHIGVGSRTELPIDNDYDEAYGDFDVTQWEGPADFFTAVDTLLGAVTDPDVVALESFGLSDYLLTSYANAYGTAEETAIFGTANATIVNQDSKAWIGEGTQLTATAADDVEWTSGFSFDPPDEEEDPYDLETDFVWNWLAAVDVDARSKADTISVSGNLSLLSLLTHTTSPSGTSVGGSFGWTQFGGATIAGIGDGAYISARSLDVQATTEQLMYVIAPSAGQGESVAGNGIFSLAQIDNATHASISNGARIDVDDTTVFAGHNVALWAIGGAVAVSSGTSIGAAVAVNSVETDTHAFVGDNSGDRALKDNEDVDDVVDVAVAGGLDAGIRTNSLSVHALSQGEVGAIGAAGAVARSEPDGSATPSSPAPASPPAPPAPAGNSSFTSALSSAGSALGGGGGASPSAPSSLTGAGSGTLNFSRLNTLAEIRDIDLLNSDSDSAAELSVRALTDVDQVSASGAAAVSISSGQGSRSSAIAGAVAFNDIDNTTRAGVYNFTAPNDGSVGDVDVLAATSGDALSLGVALAATSSSGSTAGAAISASIANIEVDTTAEIADSELNSKDEDAVTVTGYDRSRVLAGGGALSLNLGGGSGAGVGLAATYAGIDSDVSAFIRGSTLSNFSAVDVNALGASRILAGAFGGSVGTGSNIAGAGSLYIVTLEGDLAAGITGSYGTTTENSDQVTDYTNVLARSDVEGSSGVNVSARSSEGVAELDSLFIGTGLGETADFDGSATLGGIDADQIGFDPTASGLPGEAIIGFAGSLAVSGSNAAGGFAVGFTDLQGSYVAEIRDADVTADDGDVNVEAINSRQAIGVAVGASVSGGAGVTLLGSAAITLSETAVKAQVLGDSTISADHVDVHAGADGKIFSLAGSLSASSSGSAAIGAAATYNEIGGEVTAQLGGATVITDGSNPDGDARTVDVTADQDADIRSIAIAASGTGGSVAIGGSATINSITTTTSALLDTDAVTADSVRVAVRSGTDADKVSIWSLAGSITASNNAGFGAAIAFNSLNGSFDASVDGTQFTDTDELLVNSTGNAEIKTLAISGGAGGSVSAGISDASSVVGNTVAAHVDNVDLHNNDARVDVSAADHSSIDSLAGAVQIGGTAAVGVAVATNSIGNTIEASLSGGNLEVENVLVDAVTAAHIQTIAAGVAVSGTTGLAGSLGINLLNTQTLAGIDGGANVLARHNVGVTSHSDDTIDVVAGAVGVGIGAVGGGLSVVVNNIDSTTKAAISGATTSVSALALDAADTLTVTTGDLVTTPDVNKLEEAADFSPVTLDAETHEVTGVAVNAQSLQSIGTFATTVGVSASVGSVGVAVTSNTNIVGGSTLAYVDEASINTATGAHTRQDVDVRASSHAYTANMTLGLSGSGGVSATGTLGIDTVSRDTEAWLRGADVHAADAVNVKARTSIGTSMLSVGGAAGPVGAAGSGNFALHDATTLALLDGGTDITASSLVVNAEADNEMLLAGGALAIGGTAAAGAIDLAISSLTTEATIDDKYRDNTAGDTATIDITGNVAVTTDSNTAISDWAVGAAGGGGVGIAGSIAVNVVENSTTSRIKGADIGSDHMTGRLDVTANDTISVDTVSGAAGLSVGTAGIGAGLHVSVVHDTVNALVENSDVTTSGAVKVTADSSTDVDALSVAAGAGLSVGISGAVSVAIIGSGERGDANDEIGGTLNAVKDIATGERTGGSDDSDGELTAGDRLTGDQRNDVNSASSYDLVAGTDESLKDTTTAHISGGTIEGASVDVIAVDKTHLKSQVGAAAGGAVGVGGAVTIDRVYNTVNADIIGNATVISRGDVKIQALAEDGAGGPAIDSNAFTGAAGIVGLGAAIADGRIDNQVKANLDATVQDNRNTATADYSGNTLLVDAQDTTTVDVDALGAALGAAAAGIVVADAGKDSTVSALVTGSNVAENRAITISAVSQGGVDSHAVAAAGGLLVAASGAVATAIDASDVDAGVVNSSLAVNGFGLKVTAFGTPDAHSEALGVGVSGYASVGASVATAKANSTVDATLGGGVSVTGSGAVNVLANVAPVSVNDTTASGQATGAVGGGLFGGNATVGDVFSDTRVKAAVLSGSTIDVTGATTVAATNTTNQRSDADSFTVGLIALGANVSNAKSTGTTTAIFDGAITGTARHDLAIRAIGNATNKARSEAGSGGVIAGAASSATARDTSSVSATLGTDAESQVATLDLTAQHTSNVNTDVNSTQASLVGMSGAWGDNIVDVDVTATVEDGAVLRADNIGIVARGVANKEDDGFSVVSGSGGAFNAAAASTTTTVDIDTLVDIHNNAVLEVTGRWQNPGTFTVLAENQLGLHDLVKMDAGGAIAIAAAESLIDANVSSIVNVGNSARLVTVGDLILASRTDATVVANTNAKTYGAAGAAQGESRANVTADHKVNIGDSAYLQSYGDTTLAAGRSTNGAESVFDLTARTDLWNKTAFPVNTDPDADAILTQTGSIYIASNAEVRSVSDIYLTVDKGNARLTGKGVGKDLYRQVAADVANAFGSLVGAGEVSLDIYAGSTTNHSSTNVIVNGSAKSGIYHDQYLTINYTAVPTTDTSGNPVTGFTLDVAAQSEGVNYQLVDASYSQVLMDRLAELYKRKNDYAASPIEVAAFQSEINLIEGQLVDLGHQIGLTDAQIYDSEGNVSVPAIFPIKLLKLDDIIARPGNVEVIADNLLGSGILDAPGDARIVITNNSPAFLSTGALTIPDRQGGRVTLNHSLVNNSAEINAVNKSHVGAGFSQVNTAQTAPDPRIVVENNFNPSDLHGTLGTDLYITGDILNRNGLVKLSSSKGSVLVGGDVRANTTEIGAGENVVLGYIDSFRHIGSDPSGISAPDPGAITVAGNSLIVSARYINVNGLLQSGIPDWSINIDNSALAAMTTAYNHYLTGGPEKTRITVSDPLTGTIGYRYNAKTDTIELDAVDVSGGYMELTGTIMSTGAGEIRVLDGYGRVQINNTTSKEIDIAGIDLGSEIEGRLRINDGGLLDGNPDHLTSTIYARVGDSVQVYQGDYEDVKTTSAFLKSDTFGRSSTYDPRSGLDYIWLDAVSNENKRVKVTYADKAIGFIPSGSGTVQSDTSTVLDSAPVDASDYLGVGMISGHFSDRNEGQAYDWGTESITTDDDYENTYDSRNWTTCETRVLGVCVEHRAWQEETWTWGTIAIHRRGMKADNTIDINFIGNDAGVTNIDTLGDLVFSGSLLNASGTVNINANSISQISADAVIEATDLTLNSIYGIGSSADVRVDVGGEFSAFASSSGDINIDAVAGDLNITGVSTANGNVSLSAQNNINSIGSASVKGNAISLDARQGAIGTSALAMNIDTGTSALSILNANGAQGIFLKELTGDLKINLVDAAASDVALTMTGGALLDANTTQKVDERLDAEIQDLWNSMSLTGADAQAALDQELVSQERAGQTRYDRYWSLRNTRPTVDGAGNITGYTSDAYDVSYDGSFTTEQQDALALAYGWQTAGEKTPGLADLQAKRVAEYQALNAEFGAAAGYDDTYVYALDQSQIDAISEGYSWSNEQLNFSISKGLVSAPGANTGVIDEDVNIRGRNISINAGDIGRTLDETLSIDLSGGVRALTDAERRALATAEYDDIALVGDVITVVQRDDIDIDATGTITATATNDAFIGGEHDFNLYNVSGQSVRIKTDGSLTTANNGNVVLSANDVILEGSNGNIGAAGAPLGTAITGELTARTTGSIYIDQSGDLLLDRVFGNDGVSLVVDGNLYAARNSGSAITGGAVNLKVLGDVGTLAQRFNVALGLNEVLASDISGNAWLGAEQGLVPFAGNLALGQTDVDGRLDIGSVASLVMNNAVNVAGFSLTALGNWNFEDTASLDSSAAVNADVSGVSSLQNVTVTDNSATAFVLSSDSIIALGAGRHLDINGAIDLDTTSDIGAPATLLNVGASRVDATSLNGDIYLNFFRDVTDGGDIVAIDGNVLVDGDADLTLNSLFANSSIVADDVAGTLSIADTANSGGTIDLRANALDIASLTAAGAATLDAGTFIDVDTASSGAQLLLDAGSTITATTLNAVNNADLTAVGSMTLGSIASSAADVIFRGGADVSAETVTADGNIDAQIAGLLDVETARASNIDIHAGSADIEDGTAEDSATYKGHIEITTAENQHHGVLRAQHHIDLVAGGEIVFRELYSGLAGAGKGTQGDVLLDAGTDVIGNLIDAGRNVAVSALGDFRVDELNQGGALELKAGRNIFARVGGDIIDVKIDAGNNIELYALGLNPGSNGDIRLESVSAGGLVALNAAGDIRIQPINGSGGFVDAGGAATFIAGGDIEIDDVRALGEVSAAGNNLNFNTINSGANINLEALGNTFLFSAQSLGTQDYKALGEINFDQLRAGDEINSASGGDTVGRFVSSGKSVSMTAGMIWDGIAATDVVADADLIMNTVEAPEVRLRAGGSTLIDRIRASSIAKLWGKVVKTSVEDVDNDSLEMAFAAGNDELADTVELDIDTDGALTFTRSYARSAKINTSSDDVEFNDAWITELMTLQTLQANVLMDQLDPTVRPVQMQLFEEDKRFELAIDGMYATTTAYVVHYRPGFNTEIPNFQEQRDGLELPVNGPSAERQVNIAMEQGRNFNFSMVSPLVLPAGPVEIPIAVPVEGAPVNTDEEEKKS